MKKIGRYETAELLGQGAMARVYRAFDPAIQRALAIKVLRPEPARDDELRQRFLREAKAAGNLSHPNIVTVYDVGEADGHSYMTMELLAGETLEARLRREGRLDITEVLRIGIELADALDYAHAHGVVHRDIKPSNIVRREDNGRIKITDFGIAHMKDVEADERTKIGTVLGTPHYMSPEQVLGREVDGRSDLFSTGVLLYQALTGTRPYTGDTQTSLFLRIANESAESIANLRDDLPAALIGAIEKLLRKDPGRRFQTGEELKQTLERILGELDSSEQRERDFARMRVRWPAFRVAVVAATMLIGTLLVRQSQSALMTELALDYGVSLVEFVAFEAAEPMLFQDWVALQVFVSEADKRQGFAYLTLIDHVGTVRASTDAKPGTQFAPPTLGAHAETTRQVERTRVVERTTSAGTRLFDFDAPVVYRNQEVGRIYLGMTRLPIDRALRVSTLSLVLLTVVAIVAAGVTAGLLGVRVSNALRRVRSMLADLRNGRYTHRIDVHEKDEFAPVFHSLNRLAEQLDGVPPEGEPLTRRNAAAGARSGADELANGNSTNGDAAG